MDPEKLRRLLAEVRALRDEGVSEREISRELRRIREVPFNSVTTLEDAARNQGVTLDDSEDGDRAIAVLTPIIQGLSGSLASDVLSGLEKIGVAREGASERFREDLGVARERGGPAALAVQGAGLLAGPGAVGARAVTGAARAAGARAARAGGALAARAGGSPLTQIGAREAARGLGAAAGGGAAGAAVDGLLAFGESAGKPIEKRVGEAVLWGALGGLLTAPITALQSGVKSARSVRSAVKQRGEELAKTARRVGQDLPTRATVSRRVEQADEIRREAFRKAEAAGQNLPTEVTETLMESPLARNAVRNAARQGSPEAKKFLKALEAFDAGSRKSVPAASFGLADDVRKQLKRQADAFAIRPTDATAAPPSAGAVQEASRVKGLLDEALGQVTGFDTALRATAVAAGQRRAFDVGRKISGSSFGADEAAEILAGKAIKRGKQTLRISDSPQAREAFRAGMARPIMLRLQQGGDKAEAFLRQVTTGSEIQDKMRLVLGGEPQLQQFLQEAERLIAIGQADKISTALIKAAGFLGFGTSLFGGAAEVGILGG